MQVYSKNLNVTERIEMCLFYASVRSNPPKVMIQSWSVPAKLLHMDNLSLLYDNKYFIPTNYFTKLLEIFKTKCTDAFTVINYLRSLFSRFGIPDTM